MRALIFIAVFAAAGVAVWFGRDDLVDALERQQIEPPKILKTKAPEPSEMTEADFIKAVMYRNLDSAKVVGEGW